MSDKKQATKKEANTQALSTNDTEAKVSRETFSVNVNENYEPYEITIKTSVPKRIVIIAGGTNHERDVSLASATRVSNALRALGHTFKIVDLNEETIDEIRSFEPDLVWPLIHGDLGEDGSLQDLLETLDYPYVGSDAQGCRMASIKPIAKSKVIEVGLTSPEFVSFPQRMFKNCGAGQVLKAVSNKLGYPLVIKPSEGGSALGVSFAHDDSSLREAMIDAFMYGQRVVIEKAVKGVELAVSVVEFDGKPVALPIVEVSTREGDYDFDARYIAERTEYFTPARITEAQTQKVKDFVVKVHETLGLKDLSRIDVIMDKDENIWFLDANVTPGMTDTSLLPQATQAHSSFEEIIEHIVQMKR